MRNGQYLNPQHYNEQETYELKLHKRERGNNAYTYSKDSVLIFKGRPANKMEVKIFRVVKGVNGSNNSITVYCSNLPNEVDVEDKVDFMGKIMTIKNIGLFFNDNGVVNASIFSNEYLEMRCPKGITLE